MHNIEKLNENISKIVEKLGSLRDENEYLRLEIVKAKAENEAKSSEIERLVEQNNLKDLEIEEIVQKIENIMA